MTKWSGLRAVFYLPNARRKIAIGLAAFAVYLSVAIWLKHSYVPLVPPPGTVLELKRPFNVFSANVAYYAPAPSLDGDADGNDSIRSPYVVYEDNRLLGPGHVQHSEIGRRGHGRFSHWRGIGFIISASDGTNPDSNGRKYRAVLPP